MHAEDERSIRATLTAHTELWVRHEMRQWGEYFTEDSDFITHRGIWWRTREANVRGHLDVPESVVARKRDYTQEIVAIDELAPGVALVHTRWSWPGHVLPGTATAEDRQGFITLVLVRHYGEWRIRAAHNTRTNGLDDFSPEPTAAETR
ncbi:SgcJ/EcaC family oxidoreductase [Nocardia grenadensis]|uniref:SgcJ/EcaC family oxidoreductase n=1 Tax=Nocardia grenadensis TaxID=931537 RepID=UPI003D75D7FA